MNLPAIASLGLVVLIPVFAHSQTPERLQNLPMGWRVASSIMVDGKQTEAIGKRLGATINRLTNTTLVVDGRQIKINIITCPTEADAERAQRAMLPIHNGNHAECPRDGVLVLEIVCPDQRLIERAYDDLKLPRPSMTYTITFRAAPVEKCDYMHWNKLFNAFLSPTRTEESIRLATRSFTFGNQVRLRIHGQGEAKTEYVFAPKPVGTKSDGDGIATQTFANLPRMLGTPYFEVRATVTSACPPLTQTKRKVDQELLAANEFWPTKDLEIVALARKITEGKTDARSKADAILAWLMPGKNIRFAGDVTGSRYGVAQVLKQGYGHCWDFSDCFVTLCRAAGVPSRQVLGWLHGVSGHVWAEVLVEGRGWLAVDPTAGRPCDCRHIPLVVTEDGRMPFVYVSPVSVQVQK